MLFLSVEINPLYTVMIVIIVDISSAIIIMEFMLAPAHIIIIGPKDTFGRLLIIVR